MANKIKYGLKNVYYAVATINSSTHAATYGTPVSFPGAVSLSLEPQGDQSEFYADNIAYWTGNANNGYEGDLEIARVIDSFKTDILGYETDDNGVLVEAAEVEAVHFALLFQFEGDSKATKHVMYNCTATRPSTSGQTKDENIEPQTESITIKAKSIYNAALDKEVVKAETVDGTDSTTYSGWTSAVYQSTESE